MFPKEDLSKVLSIALQNGGDFADIHIEEEDSEAIGIEHHNVEQLFKISEKGAGIRLIRNEISTYAYTNDMTVEGLMNLARKVSQVGALESKNVIVNLSNREPLFTQNIKTNPIDVDLQKKIDSILSVEGIAWNYDKRIRNVMLGYNGVVKKVTIANSNGIFVNDKRVRVKANVRVVAGDNGMIQSAVDARGGFIGLELIDGGIFERLINRAVKRVITLLSAKPAPAGVMPVVIAGDAGGVMVHEACGHGLEADLVLSGNSTYTVDKLGTLVASPLITVVDDGTIPGNYGSSSFDDEGTYSQRTVLIENGILKGYMHDYTTARKFKCKSTGNGRKTSYEYPPQVRMTNTLVETKDTSSEEIIANTKKGLLVKAMGGGNVNLVTGDFTFEVTEGYIIEDGKITYPVRGATIIGNGPKGLKTVDMVGNDLGFYSGHCGKIDQLDMPVTCGQPTLRFPEMVVGGTGS